ncbi:MAG: SIS domain-containing protein, partial [Anaerolineaceae bacterium]
MPSSNSSNPMRDQVFSLPELIREQVWTLESRTRKIITTPEMFAARDVVLTGSGDSYISAMAAEAAFTELAGVRAQALSAMQASRYHARRFDWQYPSNPLVLAVSNSGEVARVVEAVQHYNDCGALTVAVTGNSGSRLGQAAHRAVEVTIPPFASAPGVRSYYGSLLALYLLEVRKQRGAIVKTLSTTSMLEKLGKIYNVPVYETGVGFKYVAPKMLETDAMIGGEESGGYAFRGNVPERDGILAGLYMLDMMVKLQKKPSELLTLLFSKVGGHYYDRIDRSFTGDRATREQRILDAKPETIGGLKVMGLNDTDGYKFLLEDGGWLLIRFSGTEPIMR